MKTAELDVVTGAFSHTGKYIARRLFFQGKRVRTLTGHPNRENLFGYEVEVFPLNFENQSLLAESLKGATTLYNTYWIRFPWRQVTFDKAVENTKILIKAAGRAGVPRIVHISITNPSKESPFPYFRGKALVEEAVIQSRLSYAIIRPTVMFGKESILINNIAWLLRRLPIFAVSGSGEYRIQPVFVDDVAEIAISAGSRGDNIIMDAVGPEVYTFNKFIRLIAHKIDNKARIVHLKPKVLLFFGRLISCAVKDVVVTRDEILGLMSNLLVSGGNPTGQTLFSKWLDRNAFSLGVKYYSELKRHYY